ncbi:Ig-like domain-containing protein [Candidatus Palauibacter sp.]|uniref:Ig-like domain-containing protein n=1 Tax=Candidatus Palauibacter sp. TaxID=3101350 RepID=UPI003AF2BE0A
MIAVLSCGEDTTAPLPPPPPPEPSRPASLAITPSTLRLEALGDTARLVAEVLDRRGQVVTGASVTWESGDPSVATVDAAGLVTAAGNGTVSITASAEAASDTAAVTVNQVVGTLDVSPDSLRLEALGDTARLVAEVLDRRGRGHNRAVGEPGRAAIRPWRPWTRRASSPRPATARSPSPPARKPPPTPPR